MAACKGCGSTTAISVLTFDIKDENNKKVIGPDGFYVTDEKCNECSNLSLSPQLPRDAEGNVVKWGNESRYSYSMGKVIHSAKDVSDFCKAHNMRQAPDAPDAPTNPT